MRWNLFAATLGVALSALPASGQTRQEAAAQLLARVDSIANWTDGRPFIPARSGPTVIVVNSRASNGPFGPLVLTPIEPLSRQPYAYWPAWSFPYWSTPVTLAPAPSFRRAVPRSNRVTPARSR